MKKNVTQGAEARKKLLFGINKLANAVKSTLGAGGNTVIIEDQMGRPHVTKDGVTVAKSILLKDPIENMGCMLLREASEKTGNKAGDGTTTATVLAQHLIINGNDKIEKGDIMSDVKRGMEYAVENVGNFLKKSKKDVSFRKLKDVATISANNDEELGEIIASAFKKVGDNGVVTHEESKNHETYVDYVEGLEIDRGWLSRIYITDRRKEECVMEKPLVLVSDVKIKRVEQIQPFAEYCLQNQKGLFIISDMEDNVLNTLTVNRANGMDVGVVKPASFGVKRKEILEDICVLSGATLISEETGDDLSAINFDWFGKFDKVVIGKGKTTMTSSEKTDEVKAHIEQLQQTLSEEEHDNNKEWLKERISKLDGGAGVVYVGGHSEAEMKEKRDRVDDAIEAVKSALEEGIVAGGGIALYDASYQIPQIKGNSSFHVGVNLVKEACHQPLRQILINAGKTSEEIEGIIFDIFKSDKDGFGYDVKRDKLGNMINMGIIDPLKVTRTALENAVSVASTILSTTCTVTNIQENGR